MTTIEGLLKRLKACENDSEKFALLIVVSKVIKPDLMSPELQEKLSQAVSFKFVSRLLRVDSRRENSGLYWQIAAAVLKTCFLSEVYLVPLLGCVDRLIEVSEYIMNIVSQIELTIIQLPTINVYYMVLYVYTA